MEDFVSSNSESNFVSQYLVLYFWPMSLCIRTSKFVLLHLKDPACLLA